MAQSVSFTVPTEYSVEQQALQRRRKMAEMLQAQSLQPLETNRMAGGYVVPVSPFEGMAKLAQAYVGKQGQKKADEAEKTMAANRQKAYADTLRSAHQIGQGTPIIEAPSEELGGGPGRPAMPGNRQAMIDHLLGNPDTASIGAQEMIAQLTPKAPKMRRVEIPDGQGGARIGFVDMNSPDPMATFKEGGLQPPKPEMVNTGGQITPVNPYQAQPMPITAAPGSVPFAAQDMTPEQFRDFQTKKAAAGASRNTNIVNAGAQPGDDSYMKKRREGQATQFQDLEKSAESAARQIQALDRFIAASEKGAAGGAQPLITSVQNFLSSFGYSSEQLKDTVLMKQVIGDVLGNKMAELGARGLTDKDMEILREALPRVATDRASRVAVANVMKKNATRTLDEYKAARSEEERIYPGFSQKTPTPGWFRQHQGGGAVMRFDANGNPVR